MAKFNISTAQPGQVDRGTQAVVETPVEKKATRTPQANAFEELLAGQPVDTDAVSQEIIQEADKDPVIEEQRERERVAPIGERLAAAEETSPKWQTKEVSDGPSGIDNLRARAGNMVNLVKDKELSGGWGIGSASKVAQVAKEQGPEAASQALQIEQANSPSAILNKAGATTIVPGTSSVEMNPKFIATLSAVTENYMMGGQIASEAGAPKERVDEFTGEPTGELERPAEDYQVAKSQGNLRLGQDINREFQRIRNQEAGRPTDEYEDLSPTEATVLGDLAKELFYEANPELINRDIGTDGQVYFTVNAKGISELEKSNEARKRLFPTTNIRPSKTPLPKGELVGEGRKLTRKFTKKAGKLGDTRILDEAIANLNEVPNVVDPRRSRVLLTTALPAIIQAVQGKYNGTWNNTVGIGTEAVTQFEAAKALDDKRKARDREMAERAEQPYYPPRPYNVRANMDSLVDSLAQAIRATAIDRKGANHLTYAIQPFTGRVFPQQTYFDPTSSKIVRFATRNATPSIAKPGNRVEANLKQMYAMMMIKEASEALPQERLRLLDVHGPKMYEMGKTIKEALDNTITNEFAEQVAVAIENNIPLTDPNFPQVPELKLPQNIVTYIESKGDDALSVMEGLIDYSEFVDAMKEGRSHPSYFNAYMDGKTNGIANNGMQLGNEVAAYRTGVLRNQDKRLLDNDIDIRDQLGTEILHMLDQGVAGIDSLNNPGPVYDMIKDIAIDRPLQKATTMQFGYGKELDSFKSDVEEWMAGYAIREPEKYKRALDEFKGNEGKLRDTAHAVYMDGLVNALSEEAAEARAIMRANATMYALTDQIFSIKSPIGFNINMAGTQILPAETDKAVQYSITKDGKRRQPTAYIYSMKDTSAAERKGTPGLYAYGRSLPSPVQSIDAATVAKTVTGKSWEKLKQASNGNPYIHTIYDAFKVDANGYSTVLKETNSNWFNTTMDWSYLEQTRDAAKRDMNNFWKEFKELPNELDIDQHHGARMMDWLLTATPDGKSFNLVNRIVKTLHSPNLTPEDAGKEAKKQTEFAIKVLTKMGWKPEAKTISKQQYEWFVRFMENNVYNLHQKNSSITDRTNKAKGKLRQKIAGSGQRVYQYYSH